MKPIEKAAYQAWNVPVHKDCQTNVCSSAEGTCVCAIGEARAAITAFFDAIQNDPEARARVISNALEGQGYNLSVDAVIAALKQEANR